YLVRAAIPARIRKRAQLRRIVDRVGKPRRSTRRRRPGQSTRGRTQGIGKEHIDMKSRAVIITSVVAAALLITGRHYLLRADYEDTERFLFIWAGDQSRTKPDFVAVVDFDPHSPHYGKVISTAPLPGPGATGNEPHHVGLSADGRILAL